MSKFTKIAIAATMTATILGSSLSAAEAGKSQRRAIGLGIVGAIVGAAIINESYRRGHYRRDCWWEKRRRWNNRKGRYVWRKVKFCD